MKIVETVDLISVGDFATTPEWLRACKQVRQAVRGTDWPHGSGKFTIFPESGKRRGQGNGVLPIKIPCLQKLRDLGWQTGRLPPFPRTVLEAGDLDAWINTAQGYIGFEWETGNISSSHRAINKLLLTLKLGGLVGGFLVVPGNRLKVFLTDRVGNIGELRPYFALWKDTRIRRGTLQIIVVEHDAESFEVPKIPKMTAGRALG